MSIAKEPNIDPAPGRQFAASEIVTRGGVLRFTIDEPFEEGGRKSFRLNESRLIRGIEKYSPTDTDNIDGPIADAILQTALFGEVIYG